MLIRLTVWSASEGHEVKDTLDYPVDDDTSLEDLLNTCTALMVASMESSIYFKGKMTFRAELTVDSPPRPPRNRGGSGFSELGK